VKTPIANPAKVVLLEHAVILIGEILHLVGIGRKIFEQIKPYHFGFFAGLLACNLVAKAVLENPTGSSKLPAAMPRVSIAVLRLRPRKVWPE
jgi:hypothetical protein